MTTPDPPPKAPRARSLSSRSRQLRAALLAAHVWDVHEVELLNRALAETDLADECARIIEREGLVIKGRAHPLLATRRDSLQTASRYWRQLRFTDDAAPRRAGRPKGPDWSSARAAAAQVRRLDA